MPRSPALQLVCVGRLRPPHAEAGGEYERRVGLITSFRVDEVPAAPLQRGAAPARAREAVRIRGQLARNAWTVALSPVGQQPASSEAFAVWLERRMTAARPVAFVVGGASGLDDALVGSCKEQLSLGALTMPHQLARVVLVEQLYRALCLLQGHPYPH
jgi:23S rRNA (pseudouridine1915-N3)-methyltransferase